MRFSYGWGRRLRYVGAVGPAFVHAMRELLERLNPLSQKQSPFAGLKVKGAVWVRPELRAEVAYRDFTIAPRFFQGAAGGRLVAVNEMERCGSLLLFEIITRTCALAHERTNDKGRGPDRATMPTARAKSAAVTVLAPEATPPRHHAPRRKGFATPYRQPLPD
jgi:hypothetical protein